jgi:streptomycin 6-kinase
VTNSNASASYVDLWNLTPDGAEIVTPRARVFPVRHDGSPAILKVLSPISDEADAPRALAHFAGRGAVRVLAEAERAVLLERAVPGSALTDLVAEGRDDDATRIIADIAAALHVGDPPDGFPTVEDWADGFRRQRERGHHRLLPPAMLDRAETLFREMAASQAGRFLLHGDLHHDNILLGERGWLVIDPKGVTGEPAFELVMALGNPHLLWPFAADRKVMARRVAIFSERLALDRDRILSWAFAQMVLCACWHIEDGNPDADVGRSLTIAEVAAGLL